MLLVEKPKPTVFMPGFLGSLTKEEKILVLTAIGIVLLFIFALIGGIFCIFSRTRKNSREKKEELFSDEYYESIM